MQLNYETNKNWINFREKKKQLESRNRELVQNLKEAVQSHQKAILLYQEKSNQSYNFFEQKQSQILQKQKDVFLIELSVDSSKKYQSEIDCFRTCGKTISKQGITKGV